MSGDERGIQTRGGAEELNAAGRAGQGDEETAGLRKSPAGGLASAALGLEQAPSAHQG